MIINKYSKKTKTKVEQREDKFGRMLQKVQEKMIDYKVFKN